MDRSILLKVGSFHTKKDLVSSLLDAGYISYDNVILSGQFSFVGDSLKIWSVDNSDILFVDFFGDEIEKIYTKDTEKRYLEEIKILPNRLKLSDNSFINRGEYIVHEDHGIGIFENVGIKEVEGEKITYIWIKYLNDDFLYVPINQIDKLSLYIGVGRKRPRLNKLGGVSWKKTYHKTYENALKMAREMLQFYAEREMIKKTPKKFFSDWEKEIIDTFGFEETADQVKAINEVYDDLGKSVPMDRLICGDVGFGKTEVAIRATAQAIANGYQAAFLVPTTILCEQHYENFISRFKNLPVNIKRLSRFISDSEKSEISEGCKNGSIDLLISTHAILRRDMKFKNLGLLVIDEEQKFGVKDKERIKQIRNDLDVLVMSATPIPRTLYMSLSGIRDISQINEPPQGRREVETMVEKYDKDHIKNFIDRELERNGQVYYLHNQVSTITSVKKWLSKLYPDKTIEVGHGQMSEEKLAGVMRDFTTGKIDILVCSTIIENGLDLPNANTLIVDESDHFGLSQMYQIRGRIGRSKKEAYALFTYRNDKLTNNATKRLKSLVDNTALGSGFKVAMQDLEIRGGGNILGKEQHGNMEAVGLVLYSKLLKLAVAQLGGRNG